MHRTTPWLPRATAVAALSLVALGCSASPSTTSDPYGAAPTTTSAAKTATTVAGNSPGSTPAAAGGGTVAVAEVAKFGKILVAADGRTLYLFEKDSGTTTACTGACATAWPALAASGTPTAGDGVDKAKLATANGQVPNQVVYNGHLLYEFAKDSKPGDVNGVTIPQWYPVSPTGDKVDED